MLTTSKVDTDAATLEAEEGMVESAGTLQSALET
jgi:hypothetical protein